MDSYEFKVGQFDCILLKYSGGPRSVASFMPSAPQAELEQVIRAQNLDPNALDFSISPLVIKTGDEIVLVDTGEGAEKGDLTAHLNSVGIAPADIDRIIITHGHGDHVGGIADVNGALVFPNARYTLWQTEWDYGTADERFANVLEPNPTKNGWDALKLHRDRVDLIGGTDQAEAEIMPGICAVAAPGHTVGQIAVELSSNGDKLLAIADAAHGYFQIACPQWSTKFDYDPAQAAETRRALFERAARDSSLLCGYHFPFPGVGHVVASSDGRLRWEQVGKL